MKLRLLALAGLFLLAMPAQAAQVKKITVEQSSFAIVFPDYVLAKSLAASTAESFTVPTDVNGLKARYVLFSSTCDFYANYTTTATVPGDTTDGSAAELNPTIRWLGGAVTTISIIAEDTCIVTASFYM